MSGRRPLPARVVVAGTASGVGKTTVATGLMAALRAAGHRVAGFKVGPDYIDPSYHRLATGLPPRNLDAFLSGPDLVVPLVAHGAATADLAVVEGVMGLFDGARGRGDLASTAQVAKLLDAPVVLVVDAGAMARSAAAVVHGFTTFDPEVRVGGIVLNRVGSSGHEALLREALAPLQVPVLGVLRRDDGLTTPSRHLGLVPAEEHGAAAERTVAALAEAVGTALDLDAVVALARSAPARPVPVWDPRPEDAATNGHRTGERPLVAVAAGRAFTFSYTENVELLRAGGAEVVTVDPLRDPHLPAGTAALVLGGGFPEAHAAELGANVTLAADVRALAARGAPVLAECAGLLYLCATLDRKPMCGVLDAQATMGRLTLGYRTATAATGSWYAHAGERVVGHEFHHSAVPLPGAPAWRWTLPDGRVVVDGVVHGAVHASYLHTHWAATPSRAHRLVAAAGAHRRGVAA